MVASTCYFFSNILFILKLDLSEGRFIFILACESSKSSRL